MSCRFLPPPNRAYERHRDLPPAPFLSFGCVEGDAGVGEARFLGHGGEDLLK